MKPATGEDSSMKQSGTFGMPDTSPGNPSIDLELNDYFAIAFVSQNRVTPESSH